MSLGIKHVQHGVVYRLKGPHNIRDHLGRVDGISQQKGQTLLLGLVLCGAGVLAWILMLELGQRVHDQSSLHRATDAAAYSAALMQARSMNLHAYLNRAQLAHQLGMAHLIAVATASQYRAKLANQASRRNPPASLIGAFFGPQHSMAYSSALSGGLESAVSQHVFRDAYLRHERHVHQALDQVRQLQLKGGEQQREHAIHRMLIANVGQSGSALKGHSLAQLGLSVSLTLDESKGPVEQYSGTDSVWRDFLTELVGQYGFLTERKRTYRNRWLVNPRCPFKRHELRRKGQLKLRSDGQWLSEESLSFHALRYNKIIGCYYREYPMGWALLNTHDKGAHPSATQNIVTMPDFSRQAFWRWSRAQSGGGLNIFSGKGNPLAQRYAQAAAVKWSAKGLGRYTQLKIGREHKPVRIAVKVFQKINRDNTIQSQATAQTYFAPPTSLRDRAKTPSLFEPYWRATLIPSVNRP
ncbi:MAG: hypothetical protein NBV66_10335 [Burkholderiaceae bacterium]|nr:hypothetical protein [Burkholderiaceae bacterium]